MILENIVSCVYNHLRNNFRNNFRNQSKPEDFFKNLWKLSKLLTVPNIRPWYDGVFYWIKGA
jgi:hypothetical protein